MHLSHLQPYRKLLAVLQFQLVLLFLTMGTLRANPAGENVIAGSATFDRNGSTLTVTNSDRAIIQWQDFSIQSGELTRFVQPSVTSTVLNEVIGGNLSAIYGTLQSNGHVVLINPAGVMIGSSGMIDTAGFIASTLGVDHQQFLNGGTLKFVTAGETGTVTNLGTISASKGDVILISREVKNSGSILAPNGVAGLYAAPTVELYLAESGETGMVKLEGSSYSLEKGVENSGVIEAAKAELKATGNLYALAIKNSGTVRANGIASINGRIHFTAKGGMIENSGTLIARDGVDGGKVKVEADLIRMASGTVVDVSGSRNGGEILIGGDYQGKNPDVYNAQKVIVERDAKFLADGGLGGGSGNGGRIIVWADDWTRFYGGLFARGGATGGDGGFAEVSGKVGLGYHGSADLSAANGSLGTLLLDPDTITIGSANTSDGEILDQQILFVDGPPTSMFISTGNLTNALAINNVLLQANDTITVAQALDVNVNTLTLQTLNTGNIVIDAGLSTSGTGGLLIKTGTLEFPNTSNITINGSGIHEFAVNAISGIGAGEITTSVGGSGQTMVLQPFNLGDSIAFGTGTNVSYTNLSTALNRICGTANWADVIIGGPGFTGMIEIGSIGSAIPYNVSLQTMSSEIDAIWIKEDIETSNKNLSFITTSGGSKIGNGTGTTINIDLGTGNLFLNSNTFVDADQFLLTAGRVTVDEMASNFVNAGSSNVTINSGSAAPVKIQGEFRGGTTVQFGSAVALSGLTKFKNLYGTLTFGQLDSEGGIPFDLILGDFTSAFTVNFNGAVGAVHTLGNVSVEGSSFSSVTTQIASQFRAQSLDVNTIGTGSVFHLNGDTDIFGNVSVSADSITISKLLEVFGSAGDTVTFAASNSFAQGSLGGMFISGVDSVEISNSGGAVELGSFISTGFIDPDITVTIDGTSIQINGFTSISGGGDVTLNGSINSPNYGSSLNLTSLNGNVQTDSIYLMGGSVSVFTPNGTANLTSVSALSLSEIVLEQTVFSKSIERLYAAVLGSGNSYTIQSYSPLLIIQNLLTQGGNITIQGSGGYGSLEIAGPISTDGFSPFGRLFAPDFGKVTIEEFDRVSFGYDPYSFGNSTSSFGPSIEADVLEVSAVNGIDLLDGFVFINELASASTTTGNIELVSDSFGGLLISGNVTTGNGDIIVGSTLGNLVLGPNALVEAAGPNNVAVVAAPFGRIVNLSGPDLFGTTDNWGIISSVAPEQNELGGLKAANQIDLGGNVNIETDESVGFETFRGKGSVFVKTGFNLQNLVSEILAALEVSNLLGDIAPSNNDSFTPPKKDDDATKKDDGPGGTSGTTTSSSDQSNEEEMPVGSAVGVDGRPAPTEVAAKLAEMLSPGAKTVATEVMAVGFGVTFEGGGTSNASIPAGEVVALNVNGVFAPLPPPPAVTAAVNAQVRAGLASAMGF